MVGDEAGDGCGTDLQVVSKLNGGEWPDCGSRLDRGEWPDGGSRV
jgi:hypothetical protein